MQNTRIVVIEPNKLQQDILQQLLHRAGLTDTRFFETARDALEYLCLHRVDLLLTDLFLPDMRGFTFIRRLASLPQRPAIAIATAQPGILLESKCMQAKMSGLQIICQLKKPLHASCISEIVAAMTKDIGNSRTAEQYYFEKTELLTAMQNGEFQLAPSGQHDNAALPARIEWWHPQLGRLNQQQFMLAIELNGLQDALRLSILNKTKLATPPRSALMHSPIATTASHINKPVLRPQFRVAPAYAGMHG